MSSLIFKIAPPRPAHIASDVWDMEWVGLWVGLASVFPLSIGYLGEGKRRIVDSVTQTYRDPSPTDSMNYLTDELSDPMWVSRGALIDACTYATPRRTTILAWLEEEPQKFKRTFAVPDSVAEYLP